MNPLLKKFVPVAEGIARAFGKNCEVILHDVQDLEHSVVLIENGYITGRKIGAPMTDLGLYFLNSDLFHDTDYVANYRTESKDGKKLKSTTIFIRDENKKIVGFLCINFNLEPLMNLSREIDEFCNVINNINNKENVLKEEREESFSDSLDELMERLFSKAQRKIGKEINKMQKEDKIEMVRYLQEHGIFLVKDAIDRLADKLNVSRFTIYNYLAEVKSENDSGGKIL
ncbi:MAG: YheO-like domain-containing protein [candidate division TA06 bacterium 34_109]|uniref:YheO-like domain-containing protein n=1 Tax=candidate division TA06 bacterium 34_109 TaxID=1635277 RepID=A0A117M5T9_UNCT6|nr:MAG: YheO-like domain-containing protein [candidate division TA06 bacterium 34_109]